jgi:perosamine synthetase
VLDRFSEIRIVIRNNRMHYKIKQLIPYVGKEELRNLRKVIENKWLTEGPFTEKFIDLIKEYTGAKYALPVCNGTMALFLAALSLDIGPGDEVIVPDFTFIASASSIYFTGAKPVFCDVNEEDFNIDAHNLEKLITKKTKAIMPVHLYGQSADMAPILKIAHTYNLKVIEDAAQGFGIYYKRRHTGTMGDIGMISFFADKTITSGEGAVILMNSEEVYMRARHIRNQGRTNSGVFIHPALGMNFRITDLQSAIGVAQFKKFEKIKKLKLTNHALYQRELAGVKELRFLKEMPYSNFIPFRTNVLAERKEGLIRHFEKNGIQTRSFFFPLHRQPCFSFLGYHKADFPVSNRGFEKGLSLPVHCDLREKDILTIGKKIKEYYGY